MPKESSISLAATAELSRFRGMRHSRPLPTGDKRVLFILVVHLCFLPWALGTMHAWSQITSLALATLGFVAALSAGRAKSEERRVPITETVSPLPLTSLPLAQSGPLGRLLRFPPFWLGLALLVYILIQAFNPSWRYTTDGKVWWLVPVPNLSWLPTSVETPFARFNLWRQFITYASAWLTLCTVWIGLTRRRSLAVLLTVLGANGLLLALVGLFHRMTHRPEQLLWFSGIRSGAITFASFIYKNHASAYLALMAAVCVVLAVRHHERAIREHARSSPALLYVIGALCLLFAVFCTYSRGGSMLLGLYFLAAALVYALCRYLSGVSSSTPRVVTLTVAGMVAFVVIFALAQLDFRHLAGSFERLADPERKDVSVSQRLEANTASLDMLSNTWPRGIGSGGFRYLYPEYIRRFAGSYNGGKLFWEHAHNDWLQLPIELGGFGVILLAAGGLWWAGRLARSGIWRRLPALLLALGLLQTLAHASFDFPFQNPAILITWLVLAIITVRYTTLDEAGNNRR
jgi:hypothetical protein